MGSPCPGLLRGPPHLPTSTELPASTLLCQPLLLSSWKVPLPWCHWCQCAPCSSMAQVQSCAKSIQWCPALCDPMDCMPASLLHPRNSPGRNTGVGCPSLLHLGAGPHSNPSFAEQPFTLVLLRQGSASAPTAQQGPGAESPDLCLHIHMTFSCVPECVQTSLVYKDTSHTGLGPTFVTLS